jgi:hypothetical protein
MLTYAQIDSNHARVVWNAEQGNPRWFKDAAAVWIETDTLEDFEAFWDRCREVYGLFDDAKLLAVVFLDYVTDYSIEIHVSVIGDVAEDDLVRFFRSLKNQKATEGVTIMVGWMLARNRPMLRIGEAAGFKQTGLKADCGESRGKVLRWLQVRA